MKTTALFVELLVTGIGTFLWLFFLVPLVIELNVPAELQEPKWLVFLTPIFFSLVYLLGIVGDRFADSLFSWIWEKRIEANEFKQEDIENSVGEQGSNERERKKVLNRYFHGRRVIMMEAPVLTAQLEYGRHRLRVCRGWSLNAFFLAVAMPLYLVDKMDMDFFYDGFMVGSLWLAISWGCWYSWKQLTLVQYKKVKRQSPWVEQWVASKQAKDQERPLGDPAGLGEAPL